MDNPLKNLSASDYVKQRQAQAVTTGPKISSVDAELVNWIFYKIKATWGEALYHAQFGDENQLRIIKRDWAKDLLESLKCSQKTGETEEEYALRAKNKIDRIFGDIRMQMDDKKSWEFPSLRRVCSFMAHYVVPPAHKPFVHSRAIEDISGKEAAREAGEKALSEMKSILGVKMKPSNEGSRQ